MNLTLIAAVDKKYGIGYQGKLLWNLPADMAFFRKKTIGFHVVMGRKTYESIGKPLKNRENYILSRQKIEIPGAFVIHQLQDIQHIREELMILGGAEIYKLCLPIANRIILTEVEAQLKADTYFPTFNKSEFECIQESFHAADKDNLYNMYFREYLRKSKIPG